MLTKEQMILAEMLYEAWPESNEGTFDEGFDFAVEVIIDFLQRDEIMDTQQFRKGSKLLRELRKRKNELKKLIVKMEYQVACDIGRLTHNKEREIQFREELISIEGKIKYRERKLKDAAKSH